MIFSLSIYNKLDNIGTLSNSLYMLQEDIKIFSCSVAGKYYDTFHEDKEIVGIAHEKYIFVSH